MTIADATPESRNELCTIDALKKIQSGQLDPKAIGSDDRRQLIEYLTAGGYSKAEMAAVLKVSERTVERDRKAVREANAIARDPDLLPQMVGRLVAEAELAVQQIRKTCRERSVAPGTKVDGQHRCYQIVSDLVVRLQGLGYLPSAAAKLQADVTHNLGDLPGLDEVGIQYQQLRATAAFSRDPQVAQQLDQLGEKIAIAGLAAEVTELQGQAAGKGQTKGDTNDNS